MPEPPTGAATTGGSDRRALARRLSLVALAAEFVASVVAVDLVIEGRPTRAGTVLLVALSARLLVVHGAGLRTTRSRLGVELERILGVFTAVVVPALVVFGTFDQAVHDNLGISAFGVLVGTAALRHARLTSKPFPTDRCSYGLQPEMAGATAMCAVLSHAFRHHSTAGVWAMFALVVVVACLTIVPRPYPRPADRARRGLAAGAAVVGVALVALDAVRPRMLFDVVAGALLAYAVIAPWLLSPNERASWREALEQWSAAREPA